MSRPPSTTSREWLATARDRMYELQALLERAFPAYFFEFLDENEINYAGWYQAHQREVELDFDFDFSRLEGEEADAQMKRLGVETKSLIESIPICVLVAVFGDDHDVSFNREDFSSRHQDFGTESGDSLRKDFPKDPNNVLEDLLAEFDSLQKQSEVVFKELLARFQESEDLPALRWVQYPPRYNDGDVCAFSVQEEPEVGWGDGAEESLFEPYEPLEALLDLVHPEVLLRLFGNNKRVTFRDGAFTTEDYKERY